MRSRKVADLDRPPAALRPDAEYERRLRTLDERMRILERERQKLSAVVHHTDAGFLAFDPSLKVAWTNGVFASRFWGGKSDGSFLGLSCCRVLCARDAACSECPAARAFASGEVAHHEISLELGGRSRNIYATAIPIRALSGAVDEAIVMLQDLSDLQILRQSEARKGAILDTALDAILTINDRGAILEFNRAAERMFGYSRAEALGREMAELIIPADLRDRHRQGLAHYLRTGEGPIIDRRIESRAMRKDGTEFPVELAITRIPLSEAPTFTGYVRDLSERKAAEEALRKSEDQLRQSQKIEAVGRLAGGVAHDFNNLLTVIRGRCELIAARLGEDGTTRKEIAMIHDAADRAAALTHQLLAFSRRQVLEPKVLDLNGVVTGVAPMLRRLIGEDVELVTGPSPDLWHVKADPGQIEQVIMNLAVNSRDAMPEGGRLSIETSNIELDETYARQHLPARPGRYVILSVSDTGTGMGAETKARLFEPFFTTKEQGKGTGLGLATVYGIVKQSGGYIWVYSEVGHGTTFKIFLPRIDESLSAAMPAEKSPDLPHGSETVLIVEDEDLVRSLARQILESYGYTVLEARRGSEALQVCERFERGIDMLLTDVVMPQMSGRDLAARVKILRPAVRVLYMSGYTDDAIVHHGVLDEGVAYLQKPFTLEALARKVREVLDQERVRVIG